MTKNAINILNKRNKMKTKLFLFLLLMLAGLITCNINNKPNSSVVGKIFVSNKDNDFIQSIEFKTKNTAIVRTGWGIKTLTPYRQDGIFIYLKEQDKDKESIWELTSSNILEWNDEIGIFHITLIDKTGNNYNSQSNLSNSKTKEQDIISIPSDITEQMPELEPSVKRPEDNKQGIINDPDGYVNIRKGMGVNFPVIGIIMENEVFDYWILPNNNWWLVQTQQGIRGYVSKNRIKGIRKSK
ncbi:hypothetical protein FACS189411_15300 [Bacteroidia bacterium]|nr:hypothetical protein FACS189411_15300 [Bacteroidia bacterium]